MEGHVMEVTEVSRTSKTFVWKWGSMDVPVKEVAIQRVPITVFSMNDNLPSDLKLSVESFDTMTSSTEDKSETHQTVQNEHNKWI